MKTWLLHLWEKLRNSFWLLPALMLLAVIVLSYGLLAIDEQIDLSRYRGLAWLVFSEPEGARAVLSTIASSTFAAATLTFSVTMVTLSLTSSQFGPRLLRNFLRDPVNQFTFGAFIATFIYCLLTMRGLGINGVHIPNISINFSIVLVLFDAALFIAFIHHLTTSIQVEKITADIGKELVAHVNRILPDDFSKENCQVDFDTAILDQQPSLIRSDKTGYVQAINYKALIDLAESEEVTIKLLFKTGKFVLLGAPLVEIWPPVHLKSHIMPPIQSCFLMGERPSGEQDLEFTVNQLVQIAARALSPGINDPFTAMSCIDYLSSGLAMIAERDLPQVNITNDQGRLLLIKHEITFLSFCNACFIIIRQMCKDNPPVVIYLLESLAQLAAIVQRQEDRLAVLQTAEITYKSAIDLCKMDYDRHAISERLERVKELLDKNEKDLLD